MPERIRIKRAVMADLEDLVRLESASFTSDRLSREQYRYLLTRGRAVVLVASVDGRIAGSAVVLLHHGHHAARLYSIATASEMRGRGVGRALLKRAEAEAVRHGFGRLSLEVRRDNAAALALYDSAGYRVVADLPGYYEDGADGVRMVVDLGPDPGRLRLAVPFYAQTTEFSCGAACLMMVMKYFRPELVLDRTLELNLWKDATTVFLSQGHGGTGPFGLALAAVERGFDVHVRLSDDRVPFISSVRDPHRKEIIRLIQADQEARSRERGVRVTCGDFLLADLTGDLLAGMVPIVLISAWRLYATKQPHWVVLTGYDARQVSFHDPFIRYLQKGKGSRRSWRIPIEEFNRMHRHSRDLRQAAVLIGPGTGRPHP